MPGPAEAVIRAPKDLELLVLLVLRHEVVEHCCYLQDQSILIVNPPVKASAKIVPGRLKPPCGGRVSSVDGKICG
ncbi:hypothetical protein FDG2_0549 [Candidatus Protofrankia californiensis]|uniref:Uncharacterized protein n=1 Tax=Candidatus Protofrankia californiensis TaxID=1839754 RepID=A0A1C3NTS8_9ACTN|nr:hypothetical protein FDG2_0549 [Candidatus Protofrankia californiensis]